MKNLKRIMAATLAMTVLFTASVMAQEPREILSQAYANSMDATTMTMSGSIEGTVSIDGAELMQISMDMDISIDIDLDTGAMMMYIRMPMTISGMDPITGESMNETVEIAMFMDGTNVFTYVEGLGWFTDPSMDMSADLDMFMGMDLDELMAWSLELNEQIMDEIIIQFADEQVEGYYVIEQFMDWDNFVSMIDAMLTPEFFQMMTAFIPEADMAELDGVMDMLATFLDDADIELEMVFRSYIDTETLNFRNYTVAITFDLATELDLGFLGSMDIALNLIVDFDINYNPGEIVWPVIDEIRTLEDIMAAMFADMVEPGETVAAVTELVVFDENVLEERAVLVLGGGFTSVSIEIAVETYAKFNVFFVNNGNAPVSVSLDGIFDVVLQGGQTFVKQIPAGAIDGAVSIVVEGNGVPLNVESGFRLTNYPLS